MSRSWCGRPPGLVAQTGARVLVVAGEGLRHGLGYLRAQTLGVGGGRLEVLQHGGSGRENADGVRGGISTVDGEPQLDEVLRRHDALDVLVQAHGASSPLCSNLSGSDRRPPAGSGSAPTRGGGWMSAADTPRCAGTLPTG